MLDLDRLSSDTRAWLRSYGRSTFLSTDFVVGGVAGVLVAIAAAASDRVRAHGSAVLITEAALGMAVLAVALTALSIVVGLLSDQFLRVLEAAGGVAAAMAPYQSVSVVGGATTLVSGGAALLWGVGPPWFDGVLLGTATWLTVWATWGTIQIVNLTAFFGTQRAKLLGGIREAQRIADDSRRGRSA